VVVVLPVLYVASFGLACRLGHEQKLSAETIYWIYRPIFAVWNGGPKFVRNAISRYFDFSCGTGPRYISYLYFDLPDCEKVRPGEWRRKLRIPSSSSALP